ncbi:MAG TPA: hypothetical protein VIY48_19160 [Candidatus Paceibacterota bacterium]
MKKLEMTPLIAFLFGVASSGGTYSILRFGFDGTQKGSIIAGVIFGILIMGCCLVDGERCYCVGCALEGRRKNKR